MREQFGDVVRVLFNTVPHDTAVCESLAIATTRYRNAFVPIAGVLWTWAPCVRSST